MTQIRIAEIEDVEAIVNIYNFAVRATFETADMEEVNRTERLPGSGSTILKTIRFLFMKRTESLQAGSASVHIGPAARR